MAREDYGFWGGGGGPEVHGRVGAPGPPRLGSPSGLARADAAQRVAQDEVAGGKRVRVAKRAHRDVLDRPGADAGQLEQRRARSSGSWRSSITSPPARPTRARRARARARRACRRSPPPRQPLGGREQADEAARARPAAHRGAARALGEAAARGHRDLLAEHRAHGELEAVPGTGHAQPRPRLDERREQRVGSESGVDRARGPDRARARAGRVRPASGSSGRS